MDELDKQRILKMNMDTEEERRKVWKRHINNIEKLYNKKLAKEYSENPQILEIRNRRFELEDMRHKIHNEYMRLGQEMDEIKLNIYYKQNPQIERPKKVKTDDLFESMTK